VTWRVEHGDCIETMRAMDESSVEVDALYESQRDAPVTQEAPDAA
jgi:hypothetical protein